MTKIKKKRIKKAGPFLTCLRHREKCPTFDDHNFRKTWPFSTRKNALESSLQGASSDAIFSLWRRLDRKETRVAKHQIPTFKKSELIKKKRRVFDRCRLFFIIVIPIPIICFFSFLFSQPCCHECCTDWNTNVYMGSKNHNKYPGVLNALDFEANTSNNPGFLQHFDDFECHFQA